MVSFPAVLSLPATRRLLLRTSRAPGAGALAPLSVLVAAGIPYIFLRSAADAVREPVDASRYERFVFGGLPTLQLQSWLHGNDYGWFDRLMVAVHGSWFIVPPLITLWVLFRYRREFGSYALWHTLALYIGLIGFVLFPVKPPWMADSGVTRILALSWDNGVKIDPNPYAAMPSLHVGLPLVMAAWAGLHRHRRLAAFLAGYSALLGFGVVFLGEHYVIDVAGAVGLAALVAVVGTALERIDWRPVRAPRLAEVPRGVWAQQRAQGLVEFALITPFVLMFMFIIVDFGIGLNHRVVVTNDAREGARFAATGQTAAAVQQKVVEQSEGLVKNLSDVDVKYYNTDGTSGLSAGDSVSVHINYAYKIITPMPAFVSGIRTSYPMDACATMRLEQVPAGAVAQPTGSIPCS